MTRPKLPTKLCNIDVSRDHAYNGHAVMYRIYESLGVRNQTIPKDMSGTFTVDGHKVTVFKSGQAPRRSASGRKTTGSHRVFLDVGGALVPAGKLAQFCKAARKKLGLVRLKTRRNGWRQSLAGAPRKPRRK